jgi:hypothetical protein
MLAKACQLLVILAGFAWAMIIPPILLAGSAETDLQHHTLHSVESQVQWCGSYHA